MGRYEKVKEKLSTLQNGSIFYKIRPYTDLHTNSKLSPYTNGCSLLNFFYLFIAFFLQSTQDIKRVISKRDGCEYLKQVPSIDGSLELV
jgi:hypothetical protein